MKADGVTADGATGGTLAGIGNTPAVRLQRLVEPGMAEVWMKLEGPTRRAPTRPHGARNDRRRRAGRAPSARSAGGGVHRGKHRQLSAFVCAVKGYPLHIVTSDAFADEKLRTMEAFGARLEVLPSPEGITPELIPRMRGVQRSWRRSAPTRPTSSATPT